MRLPSLAQHPHNQNNIERLDAGRFCSPFSGVPTTGALGFLCPNMGLRLSNPGCGVTHIAFTEMM